MDKINGFVELLRLEETRLEIIRYGDEMVAMENAITVGNHHNLRFDDRVLELLVTLRKRVGKRKKCTASKAGEVMLVNPDCYDVYFYNNFNQTALPEIVNERLHSGESCARFFSQFASAQRNLN